MRTLYPLAALAAAALLAACGRGDETQYDAELPAGATRADSMAAGAAIQTPPPLDAPVSPTPAHIGTQGGGQVPTGGPQVDSAARPGGDTVPTHGAPGAPP